MNSNQTFFMKVRALRRELSLEGFSLLWIDCLVKCQGFERRQDKHDSSSQGQVYQIMEGKTITIFLSK